MKTDEERPEYVTEAMELLNGVPSTVIELPRTVVSRVAGGEFEEINEPAWIKFSTAFKSEMSRISGNALKVWIFIALSINYNGEAFPGIKTMAKAVRLSHVTVIEAIRELESVGLLVVRRGEKRYNIYKTEGGYAKVGKEAPVQNLYQSPPANGKGKEENDKDHFTLTRSNKNKKIYSSKIPKQTIRPLVPDMPADLTEEQQFEWQLTRVVNLIDYQNSGTGALAEAFMRTRGIVFMEKDVKEQRNIASDLIKQKVKPEHVIAATEQIMGLKDKNTGRPYTCTSLKHIKQTAISLANPAPAKGQRGGQANGGWTGTNPL